MHANRKLRGMGWLLGASMAVTEGLLLLQGRFAEAIPLHLCSLSAIVAFAAAMGIGGALALDFLWYLGLPGALLALIFPAPASSCCQLLFTASYMITHTLIVVIPLTLMRAGKRPRSAKAVPVMLILQCVALAAACVNRVLGTNFLFLSAPPAGSPLERVFAFGYPVYILFLEAMMLMLCIVQSALLRAGNGVRREDD